MFNPGFSLEFDPSFSLEIINGASHVVGLIFLWHLGVYLVKETRRRRLGVRAWFFKLPVSMQFAVAIMVYDIGVWMKAFLIWSWRFLGAGPFSPAMMVALWVGSLIIVVGGFCKIRAITKPDRGNKPWLVAAAAVMIFVALTLLHRSVVGGDVL